MSNSKSNNKKAVILLSGGLDSSTISAIAVNEGYDVYALSFSYGQRHNVELEYSKKQAMESGAIEHKIINIDSDAFAGSALTDANIDVPKDRNDEVISSEIPVTYVPARNTIFLSYALGYAEVIGSSDIFIGVNAVDYSGYPDCRKEFIDSFQAMANLATKAGVEGEKMKVHTPLIDLTKAEIIKLGIKLGVDYSKSLSCYDPVHDRACGHCDSCKLRLAGFKAAGMEDPFPYV